MKHKGFTLIELLIVLAILGILVSVAIPSFQHYSARAQYSSVILASGSARKAVDICVQTESYHDCSTIPVNSQWTESDLVNSLTISKVNSDLKVTVTPNASRGITSADTYILVGKISSNTVLWNDASSGCKSTGLC